jgi:hypothetical protein
VNIQSSSFSYTVQFAVRSNAVLVPAPFFAFSINSSVNDPNLSNNAATYSEISFVVVPFVCLFLCLGPAIQALTNLQFSMIAPQTLCAGMFGNLVAIVNNAGPSIARNVQTSVQLPLQFVVQSVSPSSGSCAIVSGGTPNRFICVLGSGERERKVVCLFCFAHRYYSCYEYSSNCSVQLYN